MTSLTEQLFDYFKEAEKYGYSCFLQQQDIDRMVENFLKPYNERIIELEMELDNLGEEEIY